MVDYEFGFACRKADSKESGIALKAGRVGTKPVITSAIVATRIARRENAAMTSRVAMAVMASWSLQNDRCGGITLRCEFDAIQVISTKPVQLDSNVELY